MAKAQPQPASHWLSKLGDNERKYVEANRYREVDGCVSMHEFLLRSFKYDQKQNDQIVVGLLERSIPK